MTRGPLNKLFHRAVQCRDQPVVTRLNDHGYPNKVSMKKKEKGEEGPGEINLYIPPRQGGGIKRRYLHHLYNMQTYQTANPAYQNITLIFKAYIYF